VTEPRRRGRPQKANEEKMVSIHMSLPREERVAVVELARRMERSISYVVRRAIRLLLKQEGFLLRPMDGEE
jgi:transposase